MSSPIPNDDNAIAPDKTALMPGATATFLNYTSYSRGINGIIIDIACLHGTPTTDDFTFYTGNKAADANVNVLDASAVRDNATNIFTALKLITLAE